MCAKECGRDKARMRACENERAQVTERERQREKERKRERKSACARD